MQFWVDFASSFDATETKPYFSYLNSYLEHRTFLDGDAVSESDYIIHNCLKAVPGFPAMIGARNRPPHLSRWWTHMASLHPDPDFDARWRRRSVGDLRILNAFRAKDFDTIMRYFDIVDLTTKFPSRRASQAIHYAAKMQQPHIARELLSRGIDVNSCDGDGMTPLLYAVLKSNDELIDMFMSKGADWKVQDRQGRNIVYIASNTQRLDLITRFIELGCDPNATTVKGRTALAKTAWTGQVAVVAHLLEKHAANTETPDINGRTALFAAVIGVSRGNSVKCSKTFNDSPECAELLLRYGANIEAQDSSGNTPLIFAADSSGLKSIDMLIKHKVDIFHANKAGKTALHKALKNGNVEVAAKLIEAGLSVNYSVKASLPPLMSCIHGRSLKSAKFLSSFPELEFKPEFIYACIEHGCPDILQELVMRFRITAVDSSTLACALQQSQWDAAEILAELCDISLGHIRAAGRDQKTLTRLLQLFQGPVDIEIIKATIEADLFGVSLPLIQHKIDWLNLQDPETRCTVLHLLAAKGDLIPAQDLLEACGCPQALILMKDSNDMTAIDQARISNHNSFADFLQSFLSEFESPFAVIKVEYEDLPDDNQTHPLEVLQLHRYPELNYLTASLASPMKFVDTAEALRDLHREALAADLIGLDLECYNIDPTRHYIALIQMTVNGTDYVVDALKNRELLGLMMQDVMISSSTVKVMHGCDIDLRLLESDFRAHSYLIFDTARAYSSIHSKKNLESYASLVKEFFGVRIDKTYQVSDWRLRPLPKPMMQYARTDSHYLPELYTRLRSSMTEGMLNNLQRQMNKLTHKIPSNRLQRIRIIESSY